MNRQRGYDPNEIRPRTSRPPAAKVVVWILVVLIVLSMVAFMIP